MVINRWKMNRAKFFNFWYYTDQEFFMESGRALFRGHNGSGKSVTTQALITILLDGNTSARRLDPFGKAERNISDTLLGEDDILGIEDRIGYVSMEFKKGNSEIYKTIGMGVEAHRGNNRSPKIWYFILNGKRIGDDNEHFRLFKEEKIEGKLLKIPLTDSELKEALQKESVGQFFNEPDDYAEQVNKQLFGFETMDSYQNYISLLINTRNPKLGDTANADRLSEVLSDSLPPIAEKDLRPFFETFESIERMERDLVAYNADLQSMMRLEKVYSHYHAQSLAEKAIGYRDAQTKSTDLKREQQGLIKLISDNNGKVLKLTDEIKRLEDQQSTCEKEKVSLLHNEISELEEKKNSFIQVKEESQGRLKRLEDDLQRSEPLLRTYTRKVDSLKYDLSKGDRESQEILEQLQELSVESHFEANETWIQHFKNVEDHYSFEAWFKEFEFHRDLLKGTTTKLERHSRIVEEKDIAEQSFGDAQMKVDQVEREIIELNGELEREEQSIIEGLQEWYYNLQEIILPIEAVQRLMAGVATADTTPHDTYTKELQASYNEAFHRLIQAETETQHSIQKLSSDIRKIEENILKLRNHPEMEPPITEKKRNDWSVLHQEGIPFVPFYEAFEFKEDVPEETRHRIQDVLSELGILSAVIVPQEMITRASRHTAVLHPITKKNYNLTSYLKPVSHREVDISIITRILEGISIDEKEDNYVSENGYFRTGWIEGRATSFEEGLFIGKNAREALRLAKIEKLEVSLAVHNNEKRALLIARDSIEERKERLSFEKEQFPSLDGYRKLGDIKRRARLTLDTLNTDLHQKRERFEKIANEATTLLRSIRAGMEFIDIPLTLSAFSNALKSANDYETSLRRLERTYRDQQNDKKLVETNNLAMEREKDKADDLRDEICNEERKLSSAVQGIKNMNKALRAKGADQVVRRLEELSRLLLEIPKKREKLKENVTELNLDTKSQEARLAELTKKRIPFQQDVVGAWQSALDEHRKLDVYQSEEGVDVSELPFDEAATYLLEILSDKHDTARANISKAIDDLQGTFDKQNVHLLHYSLMRETVRSNAFENYDLDDMTDEQKMLINALREQLGRIDIKAEVGNKQVSPTRACLYLYSKIEELNLQANEKDRELYEKFLLNTLRDKIRSKIHYVRNWEKDINHFLNQKDMIKFRLKWVPKERESEEELNTKELVEALSRDQQWIDKNKIAKHFRAKIKQAKRTYKENNNGNVNLRDLIADVMDYRKWHKFELYFTKPGGNEFLLTRRSVAKLSGGQQVLSVVAPILAALHAKYLEANDETVRIFTLDEAFARVDDENKEAMFEYVRNLDFDYIINSQELWGTYETVPNLDIFDLSRPKNRPAVSVIAYHWNGISSVKTRIKPEEKMASISSTLKIQEA
ncbi:TIGR02680 family protein [Brevibacillus laterosporus]|uniref:TIGR02680 family protein n=1 Tax=Brevibacillus laterosporus TaxID=1465 RepID=A0AAP3GAL4_BRELA|nr:TIGR02680 family protein [Brevibacillus laterosporus]MCR8982545.1 TIGR02680 family protein [Brevibacillus laterosporus]MCZ0809701.1 TIGR02680 family protein [Brevibacillus laterosporus]MCZ0828234.1 TIGR02680 family protein [Brevibacillus laterosporus]MCZ0852256.1 TIGR02680 family protein [Brevibacillus laterosporus]